MRLLCHIQLRDEKVKGHLPLLSLKITEQEPPLEVVKGQQQEAGGAPYLVL